MSSGRSGRIAEAVLIAVLISAGNKLLERLFAPPKKSKKKRPPAPASTSKRRS